MRLPTSKDSHADSGPASVEPLNSILTIGFGQLASLLSRRSPSAGTNQSEPLQQLSGPGALARHEVLKGADYLRLAEFFMLTEDARKLPTRQRFVDLILDHFQIPSSAYNRISFESGWLPSYRLTPVHQLPDQIATLTHVRSLTARLFTRAEQAQNHCQIGNFGVAFRTIIDWMTSLGPIERLTDE